MNSYEREEISNLPAKYRPLGAWSYFGYSILYALPLIGFIFLIIHAVSDSNINRRSYARSFFCVLIIVLVIIGVVWFSGVFSSLIETIKSSMNG